MFPVEHVCYVENQSYQIVDHFATTYIIEIYGFLIFNQNTLKYNLYIIDISQMKNEFNAVEIIEKFKPLLLNEVIMYFPQYCFTNENYGF